MKWFLSLSSLLFVYQIFYGKNFVSIRVECMSEAAETYLVHWGNSFRSTWFLGCSLEFLSCTTVPDIWRAVLDLEIMSWLLRDGKLCATFFIVSDSVCLSLSCKTEAPL